MKIEIKGTTWQKKALIHSAVIYFAEKLSGFRKGRIKVSIRLVAGLLDKEHCRGAAYQDSNKSFRIKLDSKLKPISLIKCLSHEMIHIQQWLMGKMEDLFQDKYEVRWKKIHYPANLAYGKRLWEIEAHKLEKDLYNSWVKFWNR